MPQNLAQCDCCDYFTIPANNDYEICPVCFWEQDAWGISEPDEPSGANHGLTLREGRNNFALLGACATGFKAKVITPAEREKFRYERRNV